MPLHVLYVGRLDDQKRSAEFVDFLKESFEHCTAVKRNQVVGERLRGIDVVLLDWSQQEREPQHYDSPLGPLETWSIPTVLLGRAGLLIAGPWQVIGGAGELAWNPASTCYAITPCSISR